MSGVPNTFCDHASLKTMWCHERVWNSSSREKSFFSIFTFISFTLIKVWGFDGPNLPTCAFRFGHALSAIRSQHYDRNVRKALKFLKAAKKTTNQFNETARMNSLWTNSADLKPIISYLSSHRQWRCNEWKIYLCELACSSARPRFARGVVCGGFSDLLQDVAQKRGGPMLTIWSHQRPISPITNYDEYVEFV